MEKEEKAELNSSAWREMVYIETTEHIIKGYIFMPKLGKRSRLLTEVLNSNKHFIAVKNCTVEFKLTPQKGIEEYDFMQVNLASILLMRPVNE